MCTLICKKNVLWKRLLQWRVSVAKFIDFELKPTEKSYLSIVYVIYAKQCARGIIIIFFFIIIIDC